MTRSEEARTAPDVCAEVPGGAPCDDGDPCTTGDICSEGICAGTPLACDTPPAPVCTSASKLRVPTGSGTCAAGACVYATADIDCPEACHGGACVSPKAAVAISATDASTCALTRAGAVKCWGINHRGQLGNGSTVDSNIPVEVVGLTSGVTAISTAGSSACALTAAGAVKCWGNNSSGSLGSGSTAEFSSVPVDVMSLSSGVVATSGGGGHMCALTASGAVKCWGYNFYGELGNGTKTNSNVPVDVSGLASGVVKIFVGTGDTCALTDAGVLKCWGGSFYSQVPVDMPLFASGIRALSMGGGFMCAVTSKGAAQCWGVNLYGQLGDGSKKDYGASDGVAGLSSGVVAVSAGGRHACALTAAGALECWGVDYFGQLGDGATGYGSRTPVGVVGLSSGVVAVSAGGNHTCAITVSGGIECWGMNTHGQLGDGMTTPHSPVPLDVVGF